MADPEPDEGLPAWADAATSARAVELATRGEGQAVEFKAQIDQARDFGKEIAAFATSNAGTILLGVTDDGDIVGLAGCETPAGRDALKQRLQGVLRDHVDPTIRPDIRFGVVDGHIIAVIEVPKGDAPVYYSQNRPYLRELTAARPARPQEVIDLVVAWHDARTGRQTSEVAFLGELAPFLAGVVVSTGDLEIEDRHVKPWLDEMLDDFKVAAAEARQFAIRAPSPLEAMSRPLQNMASLLDQAAHQRLYFNSGWDELLEFGTAASQIAHGLMDMLTAHAGVGGIKEGVIDLSLHLADLARRADEMYDQNRLGEIQREAGQHGRTLLTACAFGSTLAGDGLRQQLAKIGRALREIETEYTGYSDGGQAARRVLDGVTKAAQDLPPLVAQLGVK